MGGGNIALALLTGFLAAWGGIALRRRIDRERHEAAAGRRRRITVGGTHGAVLVVLGGLMVALGTVALFTSDRTDLFPIIMGLILFALGIRQHAETS
jgi:hypothetical protein